MTSRARQHQGAKPSLGQVGRAIALGDGRADQQVVGRRAVGHGGRQRGGVTNIDATGDGGCAVAGHAHVGSTPLPLRAAGAADAAITLELAAIVEVDAPGHVPDVLKATDRLHQTAIDVERGHPVAVPTQGGAGVGAAAGQLHRGAAVDSQHTVEHAMTRVAVVLQHQSTAVDGGAAAGSIDGRQRECAGTILAQRASPADAARKRLRRSRSHDQGATVGDAAAVAAGRGPTQHAGAAHSQRTGADGCGAGITVVTDERERARTGFGQRAGGVGCSAREGERAAGLRDIHHGAGARRQGEAAVDAHARAGVAQGGVADDQIAGRVDRCTDAADLPPVGQAGHAECAGAQSGGAGICIGAAQGQQARASFFQAATAADHPAERGIVGDHEHAAVAGQGDVTAERDRCRAGPAGVDGDGAQLSAVALLPPQAGDAHWVGQGHTLGHMDLPAIQNGHQGRVVTQIGLGLDRHASLVDHDATGVDCHAVGTRKHILADTVATRAY